MTVLDDEKVSEFGLRMEIRNLLSRILLGFSNLLTLLIHANLQHLLSSSLLTAFSFQNDVFITGLSRWLGRTEPMFQKEFKVLRLSCESNSRIPSQSRHSSGSPALHSCDSCSFFHSLRTALSAIPFVSERWGVLVSRFPWKSWQALINSFELSV